MLVAMGPNAFRQRLTKQCRAHTVGATLLEKTRIRVYLSRAIPSSSGV